MTDFHIRSDSVDVEEIMHRIRARIREKRGVDYTEEEVRTLAGVKLERFLDPKHVRSDLIEQYHRLKASAPEAPLPPLPAPFTAPPPPGSEDFVADSIYRSSRGLTGSMIVGIRKLLNPFLKLFFNPTPILHALEAQRDLNRHHADYLPHLIRASGESTATLGAVLKELARLRHLHAVRDELDALHYEVLNNLVVEMTRTGIEVKNLKMRIESLSSRLDFDERRSRALEGVVQYKPGAPGLAPGAEPARPAVDGEPAPAREGRRRRRRRRRGRGSGVPAPAGFPTPEPDTGDAAAGAPDGGADSAGSGAESSQPGPPARAADPADQ